MFPFTKEVTMNEHFFDTDDSSEEMFPLVCLAFGEFRAVRLRSELFGGQNNHFFEFFFHFR